MVNYKNGKIYKIVCNSTGDVYFGSTTQKKLSSRMNTHRKPNSNLLSKIIIQRHNYSYCLVENYECHNHDELYCRLRYYIDNYDCINKQNTSNKKHIDTTSSERLHEKPLKKQQTQNAFKKAYQNEEERGVRPARAGGIGGWRAPEEQPQIYEEIEIEHKKPIIKHKIRYKMNIEKNDDTTQQQNINNAFEKNITKRNSNTRKRNKNDKCLIIPPHNYNKKTEIPTETHENTNNSDSEYETDDTENIVNLNENSTFNLYSDIDSDIDSDNDDNIQEAKLPTLNTKLNSTLKKGYKKTHDNNKFKYISETLEKRYDELMN